MKRWTWTILMGVAMSGCTPEAYKQSADLQVEKILKDRKEQTLGYTPQAEAPTTAPAEPGKKAYAKIPQTVIAPATTMPVVPAAVAVPQGPLGPEWIWQSNPQTMPTEGVEMESADVEGVKAGVLPALGPAAPWQQVPRLDLFKSIHYAVQHSRQYQDRMEDLFLATLDVTLQRHLFDPRPFARTSFKYQGGQEDVNYRSAFVAANSVGVRQQLPYGGEIVASTLVETVDALNNHTEDGQSASMALTGSIPLLRGAGLVNLEPLISSERQLVYVVRNFENYRRSFVVNIASQYFRLVTQQQAIFNRRMNYANLVGLTEQTRALFAAGRLSFIDVQRSFQNQLAAQNAIVDAEASYQAGVDDFKLALGMPMEEEVDIVPVELKVEIPELDRQDVIQLAMKYRLDLQTAKDQIEDAQRGVSVAKNGLQADVNLTGQTTVGNRADGRFNAFDSRTGSYEAGVAVDWPLDRVAERNTYRRSLIQLERSQRNFVQVRDQIASDVRDATRQIRSAQASLEIQKRSIELAQSRLDLARELLLQGKKGVLDVVDAQSALLSAQDAFELARSNLQIQVLQFLRDTGTLRLDPAAGALARAMDRAAAESAKTDFKW